jgi:superfamily II DNA or RNA helicase
MPDVQNRPADPFLLDAEDLQELASPVIVRRGIAYFKEDRVTELGWNAERIWAAVEGTRPGGYQVELFLDEDGELAVDCDCPFDWEPACKHAVATLMAYAARQPVSDIQEEGAASAALAARVQRGRSEVEVRHVDGDPWLGTYEARSVASASDGQRPWRVELRSVSERINHCTCPDFAVNRLGTCKHIEAVRHRLRKRAPRKFERMAAQGPPANLVVLDWDASDAPRVRLRPAAGAPRQWLDDHFDADGFLPRPATETLPRLKRAARERGDLVVTPEVEEHVRRIREEEERRRRAQRLAERIRASGGALPGIAARLYPYQVEGVAFLAAAGRALLADDMGLGKTLQAIAAAAVLREHDGARRALVVCPASLKHQWAREVRRFTGMDAVVVEGPPRARGALYRKRAPFTVLNYELVLRDRERIVAELSPDLLILDEAQRIKNWRTKTAAAVKSIETPFAFVLTGTPLENRLEDLYSLMQVVDPRVLGPLWRYLIEFHVLDVRGGVLGYRNLAELRRRLVPVMLRRDRSLVRDQLPDRIQTRLDVELDRRQRGYHDDALSVAARLGEIAKKRPLTPSEEKRLMAALQTARMACDAAGLVDDETEGSPKLTELGSLLEELCLDGGHKVVVFSQWERMTRMAEAVARGLGLGTVRLHGGVPTARRGALIDRFRDDPTVQVFLSTDAGGVGLNLQAATVLLNLDLPWNPAVLEQRIGRVHRLGQTSSVQVVLMVARNSYEERIAGLIGAKRELFRNVVHEDASEDVVGVSKRMIEMALGTLEEDGEEPEAEGAQAEGTGPTQGAGVAKAAGGPEEVGLTVGAGDAHGVGGASGDGDEDGRRMEMGDPSLAPLLSRLQAALGDRIERVVATGGGLVVVIDAVDADVDALVASFGAGVPLAVVDGRSWASLTRLGAASPFAGARVVLETAAAPASVPTPRPAERKLDAAGALVASGHGAEAMSLAVAAMLHAAAEAAGRSTPPPLETAAVWLHGELVPQGTVRAEDAATISRGLALSGAAEVPLGLVEALLAEARELVRELGTGS